MPGHATSNNRRPTSCCCQINHVHSGIPHQPNHQRQLGRTAAAAAAMPAAHSGEEPQPVPVRVHRLASSSITHQCQQQQQHSQGHTAEKGTVSCSANVNCSADVVAASPSGSVQTSSTMSPAQAAIKVQAAWRMSRLHKQLPVLKQLSAAAAKLTAVRQQLQELHSSGAVAAGMTQKQFLEFTEPVMKTLFLLDSSSCSVSEVRAVRKGLTAAANQLLDELQAEYQAAAAPAAAKAAAGANCSSRSVSGLQRGLG